MDIFGKKNEEIPAFYELSLKKVIISGEVFGKFGEFTIEQVFVNNRTKPLEISYTFPITETSVVTGFTVQVGDKIMHGKVKEKEEAKKEYLDNLAKGNSAYLLNQDTANVFDVMVGKVLPKEEVHIKISYLDFYDVVDNGIRLIIPTLVNPRYKSELTNGLNYGKVDYKVDFNLKINKVLDYTSIESVNHKIEKNDDEKFINVIANNYDMSKDFVLDMKFANTQISNAYYSDTKDGKKAVLLSFMPEIDYYEDSEKEYIFVIDKSGSMSSSGKMEKTILALERCLKELDEGDKFNIIPFDHDFTFFKEESVKVNDKNIKEAINYIKGIRANGGTEILNPIKFALYEKSDNKVVIVLTDGEVGNEDEIVDFISKNIYDSKLFAFGIDTSVNTAFIKAMARAGNGKAEFIYPNEKMDDAIIRTFSRIQSPLVKDVKVDYGKNNVLNEIKNDSSLFNYEFFQVNTLLEDIIDDISLKGKVGNKELSWTIRKEDIIKSNDNAIELIFVKKEMDVYEELIRSYKSSYGHFRAKELTEDYKAKIVEISVSYNISSKYTSFISVNEREEKVFEPTEFENVALSSAELDVPAFLRSRSTGFYSGASKVKRTGLAVSREMADTCLSADRVLGDMYEPRVDNDDNSLEENLTELEKMDIYTALLGIIYLSEYGHKQVNFNVFEQCINNAKDNINDETVQKLLLLMYQKQIFSTYILENLLTGIYKKIAITKASYDIEIDKLDYGTDVSKKLPNGKSLREELIQKVN